MAQNLHHRPLRHSCHRELTRRIVPEVVEREPDKAEALDQPSERPREDVGVLVGRGDGCRSVNRAGKSLEHLP